MPQDNNPPVVSVVILTWNRKKDICETVGKLQKDAYSPLEIIVVDNNSTDGTAEAMKNISGITYLPQKQNLGIAGYNIGFRAATGRYIICLDSDSYPHEDAINRMVSLFGSREDISVIAFDVHTPEAEGKPLPKLAEAEPKQLFGYHGAGAGFRKEVFEKAGYWHEPLFLYMNEIDHAIRISKAGLKLFRTAAIRAFHKSSFTARASANAPFFYLRNSYWVVWRHFPLGKMIMATMQLIQQSVQHSIKQSTTIYIRATIAALLCAPKVFMQRQPVDEKLFSMLRIPFSLIFCRY